jgi:hypothetical protein
MGHLLEDIDGDWGEGIPMIQCLVVVKNGPMSGLPDTGIEEFWPAYADMTRREKERCVRAEYQRVAEFGSRWDQVLGKLQLPPITDGAVPVHRGAGGESERHKRLKEFVRTHPEIVGATTEWDAIPEYPLPSLDEIDVLFRSGTDCIATEVKSAVSDALPADYERGIYQTIKYAALLKAMRVAGNPESRPNVRSVLILESKLPAQFRTTASVLGVTVIEDIKPL